MSPSTAGPAHLRSQIMDVDVPPPGGGQTARRHLALFDAARTLPLSVARLLEAHTDALGILAEAGRDPEPDAVYGVWASTGGLQLNDARSSMEGDKPFCSGCGVVDRALVTAADPDGGTVLVDIDVRPSSSVGFDTDGWATPALAETRTGSMHLTRHPVSSSAVIEAPGWYLARPGFWHGACGPAACWAGGAAGLLDAAEELRDDNPHRLAHLGAMRTGVWQMTTLLRGAGDQIDAAPDDVVSGQYRARALRHAIERTATMVMDHFDSGFGPRPFVSRSAVDQRHADLHLYLRQHHGTRDLADLAELPAVSRLSSTVRGD